MAKENQIKAAYLYQIIHFVQWPDTDAARRQINVCLVGDAGFAHSLAPLTRKVSPQLDIDVIVNPPLGSVSECRILYFARTPPDKISHWLAQSCRYPILTLGDTPGFALAGGMVGFVTHNNTIRLEINSKAAGQAGLSFSAKLLEVALNIFNDESVDCP